jgi:nitroimidazol reductase NimA-like FMN-containing flavoprotein (pyridoxamine 5'-phosphate oxidase superfamily)
MQHLTQQTVDGLINSVKIPIRLSCILPNGAPYVLSLWYKCRDGKIYCATQKSAKVVSYLEKNNLCGFEIAADTPPYRGIRGHGVAKICNDNGAEILEALIGRYLKDTDSKLANYLRSNAKNEVSIEITPKRIFTYDYTKRMGDSK